MSPTSAKLDLMPLAGDSEDVLPVFKFHSSETISQTPSSPAAFIQDQHEQHVCLVEKREEKEKKGKKATKKKNTEEKT